MKLGRASAGLWLVRAATLGLQAVHFAMVARLLARPDFGGWVGAVAVLAVVGAVAEFGLVQTIVLDLDRRPREGPAVAGEAVLATRGLTAVSLLLATPVAWLVLPRSGLLAFALLVPWYVATRFALPHLALRQHGGRFPRLAAAELVGRVLPVAVLAVALPAARAWDPSGRLLVVAASMLAGALASLAILREPARDPAPAIAAYWLVRRAVPLGTTGALSLVHTRVDQIVLSAYGKRLALASYGVAYRVLDAALALAAAAGAATFPALARAEGGERAALGRRTCTVLATVGMLTGLAAFVFAPHIAAVLGGGHYPEAAWLLRLLSPALVVSTVNLGAAQLVVAEGLGGRLVRIAVAGVVLNLALNLLLDGHHGARSAAVATVVSELAGFLLVWRLAVRARPGCVSAAGVLTPLAAFPVAAFGGLVVWRTTGAAPAVMLAAVAVAVAMAVAVVPSRSVPVPTEVMGVPT